MFQFSISVELKNDKLKLAENLLEILLFFELNLMTIKVYGARNFKSIEGWKRTRHLQFNFLSFWQ